MADWLPGFAIGTNFKSIAGGSTIPNVLNNTSNITPTRVSRALPLLAGYNINVTMPTPETSRGYASQ